MLGITGASGFLGRHLLAQARRQGHRVRAFVRSPEQLRNLDVASDVEVAAVGDLFAAPRSRLIESMRGIDTLIHAAWYAEPGAYLESPLNVDCCQGSIELARCFASAGGRRFVGIGTCFEYDTSISPLATDTPLAPQTLYASCKAATYSALMHLLPALQVEFAWARIFYLFGEGEDERRLVPYVRRQLSRGEVAELSSGTQVRDYLEIGDAARQVMEIAHGNVTGAVNVCSGVPVTVRELAERIADEFGRPDLLRFGVRPSSPSDPQVILGVRYRSRLATDS